MKVMILGQFPLDWSKLEGGVESTLLYLVDEMAKQDGVTLQVVACHPYVVAPESRQRGPVTVTYLPRHRFGRITAYRRDVAALQEAIRAERPDVVHAHGTSLYAGAALGCGVPAVLTVHGIVSREVNYALTLSQRVRGLMDAYYERRSVRRARYLIAIAPYVRREFGRETRAKTWDIPNAITDAFFALERAPQPNTMLYAGVVTPRKAVHELIQAVALVKRSVPRVRLRIAGETRYYPEYMARVEQIITEEGLGPNVEFLGFQSEEGVLQEYAHASVLALASHQETLPVVVQQAMAARLPLVSTAVGGVPDVIAHGKSGLLVQPGDIGGLAENLLRLLQDKQLSDSLAESARRYADDNFRAGVVAQRLVGVYQQIAEAERR